MSYSILICTYHNLHNILLILHLNVLFHTNLYSSQFTLNFTHITSKCLIPY